MPVEGQVRSPRPDPKGLLARQLTLYYGQGRGGSADVRCAPQPAVSTRNQLCRVNSRRATHSITAFACAMRRGGTVRPSALAVLRLITSSNLVGCSTGRSAGLAPLRILMTYPADR